MYGRVNGNGRAAYECITSSFLIDKCRITEFFSSSTVNLVKKVRSISPDTKLVDEAVQAWKKAFWTLWYDRQELSERAVAYRVIIPFVEC